MVERGILQGECSGGEGTFWGVLWGTGTLWKHPQRRGHPGLHSSEEGMGAGLLPGDGSGLLGGKHPPRKRSPGWGSQGGGEHSRTVEERLFRLVGWEGKHPPGKHLFGGHFPRGKGYSGRILSGCPRGASSRGPLQGETTKVGMGGGQPHGVRGRASSGGAFSG